MAAKRSTATYGCSLPSRTRSSSSKEARFARLPGGVCAPLEDSARDRLYRGPGPSGGVGLHGAVSRCRTCRRLSGPRPLDPSIGLDVLPRTDHQAGQLPRALASHPGGPVPGGAPRGSWNGTFARVSISTPAANPSTSTAEDSRWSAGREGRSLRP